MPSQPITKPCSPGSALLWLPVVLNPYRIHLCRLALPSVHREEGGSGRTPKEVWGFALHPLTLREGGWELGSAAEPGAAAFPSPVLGAVTPARGPIPLGTQAGGCHCSGCDTKQVLVRLPLSLTARGCSRAASLVAGPLCPSAGSLA